MTTTTTTAATTAEELVATAANDIRRLAAQAEAERRMPEELMEALRRARLLAIYTPRDFGGLELPLPEALRVVEEVSRHDGSTGWTVALGVANGYSTAVLTRDAAARVLGDGSPLIAGAPAFGVRAVRVDGGYRLTGRWQFNSGAPNADWIGAPAPLFDSDDSESPRMTPAGPEMVFFFIPRSDAQIVDTWHVTGMRATGTQDLMVDGVFVPEEMTGGFALPMGPQAVRDGALTRLPFLTLFCVTQAPPTCLGIARRAIDEFREIAPAKATPFGGPPLSEKPQAQAALARAEALVRSARGYWYANVDAIWEAAVDGRPLTLDDMASSRIASLTAVENSVEAVELLWRQAGTTGIFQTSALERCWRDVHTAAQHMHVQDGRWETAGRVMFGLDPGTPLV
ncbi:MAG TPA: acyl-CoA dehydrogenase family protein [Vicinamibacterales bacterium]|nr:acyl-CoA dehydrogenase family protein [Vicinamibacterales bacterium]